MKIRPMVFICAAFVLFVIAGCGDGSPLAPLNLVVASTSPIMMKWDGSLSASSYNVYRGTVSGGISTKLLLVPNSLNGSASLLTTYTDLLTTVGVTYYYQVTEVNGDKESGGSNEVSATATP